MIENINKAVASRKRRQEGPQEKETPTSELVKQIISQRGKKGEMEVKEMNERKVLVGCRRRRR